MGRTRAPRARLQDTPSLPGQEASPLREGAAAEGLPGLRSAGHVPHLHCRDRVAAERGVEAARLLDRDGCALFTTRTLTATLALGALLALPAAWSVGRVQVLPALLLPAVLATSLSVSGGRVRATALLAVRLALLCGLVWGSENPW
ncbi:MAG: hypothetical protein CMJ84_01815 [Planctomycetes bacterium]|nr:hypothetical protein [Planctomycetota bacterium]